MKKKDNFYNTLREKVVIISGASSGIGKALACKLAEYDTKLVITARRKEKLHDIAKKIQQQGSEVAIVAGDIREEKIQTKIIKTTLEQYGKISVLVNNAGLGKAADLLYLTDESIDEMIDVNLRAVIKLTKKVLPYMVKRNEGHIINIATSLVYLPNRIFSVYIATKAGIKFFSDSIRNELNDYGIKVTTVLPGPYNTQFHKVAGIKNIRYKCYNVEELAEKIVQIIKKPKNELIVPKEYNLLLKLIKFIPPLRNLVISKIEEQVDAILFYKHPTSSSLHVSSPPLRKKAKYGNI